MYKLRFADEPHRSSRGHLRAKLEELEKGS